MSVLAKLFSEPWVHRLGWALVHFLWQGTVIALMLAAVLQLLAKAAANLRYTLSGLALLLCAIAPVITWMALTPQGEVLSQVSSAPSALRSVGNPSAPENFPALSGSFSKLHASSPVPPETPWRATLVDATEITLPYLVGLWFLGVMVLSSRLALGWMWMLRLRRSSISASDPRHLEKFQRLLARLQISRPVRLLESALVEVPTLIGWLRPTILIPASLFAGMTPDQLEAIFAHELAHVRRCDYLVNLLQTMIETVLFYHPAIWWISWKIREERENCCDDIAVEVMQDRFVYASALAQLEAGRSRPLALAATGGSLLHRIRRIAGVNDRKISAWPITVLFVVLCAAGFVSKVRATNAIPAPVPAAATKANPALAKALVAAAKRNDVTEVQRLLRLGADANANVEPDGNNALFTAAKGNQIAMVKVLLQNGADPNCKNQCSNKPVDWILDQGHLEMATVLRDAGAKISPEAWAGATGDLAALKMLVASGVLKRGHTGGAMKFAVSMGHLDAVKYLEGIDGKPVAGKFLGQAVRSGNIPMMQYILDRGADIKKDGDDALNQAVIFYNQVDAVKFLLAHGVDPNRLSGWQQYPLAEATSAAMVKVLLDGGANPNAEDIFGTALSMAPDAESVRLLVQHGGDLNPKLKSGNTLIESVIVRALYDRPETIDELIKQGAEFDPKGSSGIEDLVDAAQFNQVGTIQLLLDRGVSPNAYSGDPFHQLTALGSAAWEPSVDAVKLLLVRGANPEGDPRQSDSPLAMALIFGQTESADLLMKAGAHDVHALSIASARGDAAKAEDLLKQGANVNETDEAGNTPLHYATRRAHVEIVRLLLAHGANVNLFNASGMTAKAGLDLESASGNSNQFEMDWGVSQEEGKRRAAAMKDLLAKYPPDPNYQDGEGRTALHQMAFSGSPILEFVLNDKAHPADPNIQDHDGNTPLVLAALSPHANELVTRISIPEDDKSPQPKMKEWNAAAYVADQLIKAGAKLDLVAAQGKTVGGLTMTAAVAAKNPQLISVLHDAGVATIAP